MSGTSHNSNELLCGKPVSFYQKPRQSVAYCHVCKGKIVRELVRHQTTPLQLQEADNPAEDRLWHLCELAAFEELRRFRPSFREMVRHIARTMEDIGVYTDPNALEASSENGAWRESPQLAYNWWKAYWIARVEGKKSKDEDKARNKDEDKDKDKDRDTGNKTGNASQSGGRAAMDHTGTSDPRPAADQVSTPSIPAGVLADTLSELSALRAGILAFHRRCVTSIDISKRQQETQVGLVAPGVVPVEPASAVPVQQAENNPYGSIVVAIEAGIRLREASVEGLRQVIDVLQTQTPGRPRGI